MTHPARPGRVFSLPEIVFIVVSLGLIAAVVVPRFAGATEDERTSRAEMVIAGIRTSIAAYRSTAERRGADPFPTIHDLTTPGMVITEKMPPNPFTGVSGVQPVTKSQAEKRTVINPGEVGWNYFFENNDERPVVYFYANCETPTTVPDGRGGTLTANEL